ncbi:macrophage mannose receptor 1-like isoform X1 [Galleria mellonella]|uniref:Macrophage mannose receptor 1-like isoform X1 n=1 Tax=Galleria mellonella TaxID=7137 RepID=A0A6J1X434_GALME|nr:macrophage mannose receptor 1-like isoform X1 [Galleria mellonella]
MIPNKILHILLITELILHYSSGQRDKKFFRKDYKYLEDTESFYKIHVIARSWQAARDTCKLEGASLFYPADEGEANTITKMWTNDLISVQIFIGISSLLGNRVFVTIDGLSISDVYHKWLKGEPNNLGGNENCVVIKRDGSLNDCSCSLPHNFICKKTLASLEWNSACNFPNTDYTYSETLNRCYKFHLTPKNWNEAYATCIAEQSFLAVIENQAEADYFVKLIREAPKHTVQVNYSRGTVFLGFHNIDGEYWKTVNGAALEGIGYSKWGYFYGDDNEKCGSMFYNGELNKMGCHHKSFFICEYDKFTNMTIEPNEIVY